MTEQQRLFSVTICAKRKPGMDEDSYHKYLSETHAGFLKDLLVKNKIVEYTMQHNTSALMKDVNNLFPGVAAKNQASNDAFITIVFRNPEDYIKVKKDPYYTTVIGPDSANFADGPSTVVSYGWFEKHVEHGKLVDR